MGVKCHHRVKIVTRSANTSRQKTRKVIGSDLHRLVLPIHLAMRDVRLRLLLFELPLKLWVVFFFKKKDKT